MTAGVGRIGQAARSLLTGLDVLLLPALTAVLAVGLETRVLQQCVGSASLGVAGRISALGGVLLLVVVGYVAVPTVLAFTSRIWDREGQRRGRVLLVVTMTSAVLAGTFLMLTWPSC